MALHYPDREPLSDKLQEMMNQQAAAKELFRGIGSKANKDKPTEEPKPVRMKVLLSICFVVFYLVSMALTTYLVQQDYEERFDSNFDAVKRIVSSNIGEDLRECVNCLYDIKAAQNEHQYFSAAVYDEQGKLLVMTEPCLRFNFVEGDGKTQYFPLEEYFDDSEIEELLLYARDTTEEYLVETEIAGKPEVLLSLKFINQGIEKSNVVWEWSNKNADYDGMEETVYSQRTPIKAVMDVFSYEQEDAYEKWVENEFLHDFQETTSDEERDFMEGKEALGFGKTTVEGSKRVEYKDDIGEEQIYFVSVRSTGNTLQAAVDLLAPVYAIDFVLTLVGIYITVNHVNKLRKK